MLVSKLPDNYLSDSIQSDINITLLPYKKTLIDINSQKSEKNAAQRGIQLVTRRDEIAILVIVAIQLVHRIAEQRTVLGLGLVLSYQLSLLLG